MPLDSSEFNGRASEFTFDQLFPGGRGSGKEEDTVYGEALERGSIHSFKVEHVEESNPVLKEGHLTKLNAKNGAEEKHFFQLREETLIYIKEKQGALVSLLYTVCIGCFYAYTLSLSHSN